MNLRSYLLTPLIATVLIENLTADGVPQPQVSFNRASGGVWIAEWLGISQRSYFSQSSHNLETWQYIPVIEFSEGLKSMPLQANGAPRFFFRLRFTDAPTTDPEIEDFDSDQIGSLAELLIGRDPLVAEPFVDTDGDGIEDAIEMHWFGDLTSMSATGDWDGDGIPDLIEAQAGSDPKINQSASNAARSNYQYDPLGRLTNADGVAYQFDIEGNLESSSD